MMLVAAVVAVAVPADFRVRDWICVWKGLYLSVKMGTGVCGRRALLVSFPRRLFGLGFWVGAFLSPRSLYTMSFSETPPYVERNRLESFRSMIARWKEKMTWR